MDFRLGEWTVRVSRCCIEGDDGSLAHIKPKSMAVLEALAAARGEVVSRGALFEAVWPGAMVSDDSLTQCVVELRKAFGDSARKAQVIETIPKKGFRLLPAVEPVTDGDRKPRGRARISWLVAACLCAVLVLLFWQGRHRESAAAPQATVATVAVLPFMDLSPGGDQQYFADGLSEELIDRLTRLDGLRVTARASSFYFKDRGLAQAEIGERLGVEHLLQGSIRREDDKLRVTARLVNVRDGFSLWSDHYDGTLGDVFAIQEEISEAVAIALSITLGVGRLGSLAGGTANVAAYEAFMQGNALKSEFTARAVAQSIERFRHAIDLDPDYGLAWERLANAYRIAWLVFGSEAVNQWRLRSDEALARAWELAPTSPAVVQTAAYVELDMGRWSNVERLLAEASRLDGSMDYRECAVYTDFLIKVGRAREAISLREATRRADPLNADYAIYLGHLYASQGRLDEALDELERGYGLGHGLPQLAVEGMLTALASRDQKLIERWLARAVEHQQPGAFGSHVAMAERLEDRESALTWLRNAFETSAALDYYVALWAGYYGDTELAVAALGRTPDTWAFWSPLLREVRRTEAFRDILRQIGLEAFWREQTWGDFCQPVGDSDFRCR